MRLLSIADDVVRSMDGIEARAAYVRMRLQEASFNLDRQIIYFYDAAAGASIFMQYPPRLTAPATPISDVLDVLRASHPVDATQPPVEVA